MFSLSSKFWKLLRSSVLFGFSPITLSLHNVFVILEILEVGHLFFLVLYASSSNLLIIFIMNQMLEYYSFNKIIFFTKYKQFLMKKNWLRNRLI